MIVADSEHIVLDNDFMGQLAIGIIASPEDKNPAFIFKVKSNILNAIELKHSHGILLANKKLFLGIRYTGNSEQIGSVIVKLFYMRIEGVNVKEIPSLKSKQLAELYKLCRARLGEQAEKSMTFTLSLREQPQDLVNTQFRYIRDSRISKKVQSSGRVSITNNQVKQQPKQAQAGSIAQANIQSPRLGIKELLAICFLVFLLGVSFGIKLSRMT